VKVDQRALDGIHVKIDRANKHLRSLHDDMAAWDQDRPWRLVEEAHDNGRKHLYRLQFLRPIPVEWAVILGEALHNLRSSLDQCIYWLTVDWSRREINGTAFPVYIRKAAFEQRTRKGGWAPTGGMYKIRGIGPGPQAFVEALQPYPQRRRSYCSDVRALNDLWNQDKHRLVHLWGLSFRDEELRLNSAVAPDCTVGIDRRVLHERAIVLRILCEPPHTESVKVEGKIAANLAFALWKRRSGPRTRSLWDVAQTNVDVINKLLEAIGNQRAGIDLGAWTERTAHGLASRPRPGATVKG
jgi:hypothetical protein